MSQFEIIDGHTAEGQSRLAEIKAQRDEQISSGQQIYARIKSSSKYYGQTAPGEIFPVYIDADTQWEYCVLGGPGTQYRLSDVDLIIVGETGRRIAISIPGGAI